MKLEELIQLVMNERITLIDRANRRVIEGDWFEDHILKYMDREIEAINWQRSLWLHVILAEEVKDGK